MNQGAGYGQEISVKHCFNGKAEIVNLLKKFIEKIHRNVQVKVKKYLASKFYIFVFGKWGAIAIALRNQNT